MIECVEKLTAELEFCPLGDAEFPDDRKIQGFESRPINRVAAGVTEGEGFRRGERNWIKPLGCAAGARAKDRLPGVIRRNQGTPQVLESIGKCP